MIPLELPDHFIPDRYSIAGGEGRLLPDTRRTYVELEGPGCIRHIWTTMCRGEVYSRKCIIRIYFDGSEVPHVEAPVGDFFGVMHGKTWYPLNTQYLSVMAETGYNCYFAMPFATSARIELESGDEALPVYIMVDWHRYPGVELKEKRRFCARWRRESPATRYGKEFLALDADGPGELIGFVYGIRLLDDRDRWSHGGGDNFYGDGETESPFYLRGIGGEDTFGTSYGGAKHPPETHLHSSLPYYFHEDVGEARVSQRVVGYRFFNEDRMPFRSSLQFRFGSMANDLCATTYWYQEGAPREFFRLPPFPQLLPVATVDPATTNLPLPDAGDWWLCGPFARVPEETFMAPLPPERGPVQTEAAFDGGHQGNSTFLGERSRELGRDRARWVRADSMRGFVDFNHYFLSAARGVAFCQPATAVARAIVFAPVAGRVRITLSWEDRASLTLNQAAPIDLGGNPFFRSRTIEADLEAGANEVTVKLSNQYGSNHGGWAFAFRCETGDGTLLHPAAAV